MFPKKTEDLVGIVLFIAPFFMGLYFYHQNYLVTIILLVLLLIIIAKNKQLILCNSMNHLIIFFVIASYLLSLSYALDKGMAFLGALKMLSIYIFYILLMQIDLGRYKNYYLRCIEYSGIVLALAGIIIVILKSIGVTGPLYDIIISKENRMQSFIQYANVFALWILICLILIAFEKNINKKQQVGSIILGASLVMTFSRSMYVLGFVFVLISYYVNKKNRKIILYTCLLGAFLGIFLIWASGLNRSFTRVRNASFQVSEWQTRLFYYKDGLQIIRDNIFGLGHLGYFYIQRTYQSANYYVKYIHNGFLQIALDIGIFPMFLFMFLGAKNFFDRKVSVRDKLILLLVFGHALIDFDFQFTITLLLIVLILPYDTIKISLNQFAFSVFCIIISISIFTYSYMGAVSYGAYINKHELVADMYPFYTESKKQQMRELKEDRLEHSYKISQNIIKDNIYVLEAYLTQAEYYKYTKEYDLGVDAIKKAMYLDPLNMTYIEEYTSFLVLAIEEQMILANKTKMKTYLIELINVIDYIEDIKFRIDKKAYNIKHAPTIYQTEIIKERVSWAIEQYNEMR
ncbi:MAG: O-antigen ligase family protein [Eubacteriales bacterium]